MSVSPTLAIEPALEEDRADLTDLLDSYVREMAAWFPVQPGADGRFHYDGLDEYWRQPSSRFAYVIRRDGLIAGFALVTRGSPAHPDPDASDVAEFFVAPEHRRGGVGRRAAAMLWDRRPGLWTVRVSDANLPARAFWEAAVRAYAGDELTTGTIDGRHHPFTVFTFRTRDARRMA